MNKLELSNQAALIRQQLGEDYASPIDIFSLVKSLENLTVFFYPMGANISGICYKGPSSNLIAINSEMSLGRQRFSLAHELYHLYFDDNNITAISSMKIGEGNLIEKNADQFASYFLVPPIALHNSIQELLEKKADNKLVIGDIIKLEQHFGVSHQAMLYRLLSEGKISFVENESMQKNVRTIASRLGYDTALYYPTPIGKQMKVYGHYIIAAEQLLSENKISYGKYEELLLDGFRDDIVFGEEDDESFSD